MDKTDKQRNNSQDSNTNSIKTKPFRETRYTQLLKRPKQIIRDCSLDFDNDNEEALDQAESPRNLSL